MNLPPPPSMSVLPPEAELLVCCTRTVLDPARAARIDRLLAGSLDWDLVLRWAQWHRVTPLLARSLRAIRPEAVPAPVSERLETRRHASARHNLLLTGELLELLAAFEARGITALPYKGPALAGALYDNLALREFDDLDILVRVSDRQAAVERLLARGYQPMVPGDGRSAAALVEARRRQHNVQLVHPEREVKLELHWSISSFYPLPVDRLFERRDTVSLAGKTVPHFHPEDLLLLLCVHGAKHFWKRLQWICDLAELCRVHRDLGWARMIAEARAAGGERMVGLGLRMARDVLGQELPREIPDSTVGDPAVARLAVQARSGLFRPEEPLEGTFEQVAFYLGMRERMRDRIRYSLHLLRGRLTPTAEDRALVPLPRPLSFLYYLLRPVRLTLLYGITYLRWLAGRR